MEPKVYIAASLSDIETIRAVSANLSLSAVVTSSWLEEGEPVDANDPNETDMNKRARANEDILDIMRSDIVLISTAVPSTTGGFMWEMGMAFGLGKRIILAGPKTSVFHYLNAVEHYETLTDAVLQLMHEGLDA